MDMKRKHQIPKLFYMYIEDYCTPAVESGHCALLGLGIINGEYQLGWSNL